MAGGKRRLSQGRRLLAASKDLHSENEEDEGLRERRRPPQRQLETRRHDASPPTNTHGNGAPSSSEVVEMYRKVIKMASENKITVKNAWSLSLIDHMSEVVVDEEAEGVQSNDVGRSVNFQRASCTLEAGVKIYCSRVDETFDASFRVLERLHRGRQREEEEEEGAVYNEEVPADNVRGTKGRTRAVTACKTLVEDEATISAPIAEDEVLPWAFGKGVDGGAAKDLLLQRLWCVSASLDFHNDMRDDEDAPLDERFYISKLPTGLCAPLAELRAQTAEAEATRGRPPEEMSSLLPPPRPDELPPSQDIHQTEVHADDSEFFDPIRDDDVVDTVFTASDDVEDDVLIDSTSLVTEGVQTVDLAIAIDDDNLAFFDTTKFFGGRNDWAGVSHWKLAANKPPPSKRTKDTASSSKHSAKRVAVLDFDAPPPPLSILSPSNTRRKRLPPIKLLDPDCLLLPHDIGVTPRDLYTLFLVECAVPPAARSIGVNADADDLSCDQSGVQDDDYFGVPHAQEEDSFAAPAQEDEVPGAIDLLRASHRVEKLHIAYATTASKVDVRSLKAALWNSLNNKLLKPLTFSSLVRHVNKVNKIGDDTTMAFYFICLLHLANEHQLSLHEISDLPLADFTIDRPQASI